MKKPLIILAISLLTLTETFAQTNVSGGIFANTTWTLVNSPYIVTGNVVVFPGYTLTIQPGVTVKFDDGMSLEIRQAALIASGTNLAPITFTSNSLSPTQGIYTGIYLNGGTTTPIFSYCNFLYANEAIFEQATYNLNFTNSKFSYDNYGLLTTAHATLNNCVLRSNNVGMQTWGGTLTNCRLAQNGTGMIQQGWTSVLQNCIIDSNQTGISQACGSFLKCDLKYNVLGIDRISAIKVDSCNIISNQTGVTIEAGDSINNCIIDSNTVAGIDNNGHSDPYYSTIYNNKIRHNGTGINETSGSPDMITKNVIEFNTIGIALRVNGVYASTTGCEHITCNKICNNSSYDLKYLPPINTIITQNYFCTSDSISTAAVIYDGYDNVSSGLVSFMPLDTSNCYLISGIKNDVPKLSFNIFPNPTTNNINIELPNEISKASIRIFNTIGELEYSLAVSEQHSIIDVSNLSNGLYFIQVASGNRISSRKFVKE